MRTIVAGSRSITNYRLVKQAIEQSGIEITVLISGTARGVDKLGERYARENNIPVELYPANWDKYGRQAGIIRNKHMARKADALILVWDGESPGSRSMYWLARGMKLKVKAYKVVDGELVPYGDSNL